MANPEISYVLTADNVIVEELTGKISVIGIFNDINIPANQDSVILPVMAIVVHIKNGQGASTALIKISDPNGAEFQSVKLSGPSTGPSDLSLSAIFVALNFKILGKYKISVFLDDKDLSFDEDYSITVKKK